MTDRTLPPVIAQLRHAYSQLVAGAVVHQQQFADGLIAPAIRSLEALAPLEAENAALRASLVKVNAQAEEFERKWYLSCGEAEDLQARVAELEAALQRLAQVAVWDEDSDRDEFDAAMRQADAALRASSPDQSVDANKMGGGDCAVGGEEVDHG